MIIACTEDEVYVIYMHWFKNWMNIIFHQSLISYDFKIKYIYIHLHRPYDCLIIIAYIHFIWTLVNCCYTVNAIIQHFIIFYVFQDGQMEEGESSEDEGTLSNLK